MIRRPPRSTLFPTRRSSDLVEEPTRFGFVDPSGGPIGDAPFEEPEGQRGPPGEFYFGFLDRKSTRLNSSHSQISYAVFCLKKKTLTMLLSLDHGHCCDAVAR